MRPYETAFFGPGPGTPKKTTFFFGPFLEKKDWFFPVLFFPIFAGLKKNWEK